MGAQTWVRDGRHLNRKQILEYNKKKTKPVPKQEVVEVVKAVEEVVVAEENLEELKARYEKELGKKVPNPYSKNVEWIKSKLTT